MFTANKGVNTHKLKSKIDDAESRLSCNLKLIFSNQPRQAVFLESLPRTLHLRYLNPSCKCNAHAQCPTCT